MPSQFKPTQKKLILAAEALFMEHGIDVVPLKEIATAAGQANNTAVHYHFGSREALIHAISAYRIEELDRVRARMLGEVRTDGQEVSLRRLLKILFLSQLEIADERGCHPYAHFMVQYLTIYRPAGASHASDARDPASETLHNLCALISAQLPDIPMNTVMRRLEILNLSFLAMLVRSDNALLCERPRPDLSQEANEIIEMALGAIGVPNVTPEASLPTPDRRDHDLVESSRARPERVPSSDSPARLQRANRKRA